RSTRRRTRPILPLGSLSTLPPGRASSFNSIVSGFESAAMDSTHCLSRRVHARVRIGSANKDGMGDANTHPRNVDGPLRRRFWGHRLMRAADEDVSTPPTASPSQSLLSWG